MAIGPAQAMTLEAFGRMNNDDEASYIALLVESSSKMLRANGQAAQADKAIALFNDPSPHGGVSQLGSNLKTMYGLNNRNSTNPNNRAPVYQIEDAVSLTLKNAGIIVPVSYLQQVGATLRAEGPPRH